MPARKSLAVLLAWRGQLLGANVQWALAFAASSDRVSSIFWKAAAPASVENRDADGPC